MFGGNQRILEWLPDEEGPTKANPYLGSRLVNKTKEHRFWSIFDLDGTYAAGSLEARRKVRAWSEKRGALLFSTARTPELVMTPESFELSRRFAGFNRPMPQWVYGTGLLQHDPDAILAFGEGVFIAGKGYERHAPYFVDQAYEDRYLEPTVNGQRIADRSWYERVLEVMHKLGLQEHLSAIDQPNAYTLGTGNVLPLKFRVEVGFRGADAIKRKYEAFSKISEYIKGTPLELCMEPVDESKPSDDPEKNRAMGYWMHPGCRKENMMNHGLIQTCRHADLGPSEIKGIAAGDMLTDMIALCEGGLDADLTGILVGGSPLNQCIEEKTNYASNDLRELHSSLIPSGRDGFYYYDNPLTRGGTKGKARRRTIIIGNQAYPGTIGVETIWAYIEEHQQTLAA